ncbi:MAG: ribonuclease P protein component [Pseudomonadota bacterium]|nr:ribonuclease P protein component [Pseudomonadota bacterium]
MRGHGEFSRVYKRGSRHRSGAVTLIVADGDAGPPVVGFVAGKRVGSAVMRNKAKRRMREAASRISLKPDTVYVLVAESGVVDANFEQLVSWLGNCVDQGLVNEET